MIEIHRPHWLTPRSVSFPREFQLEGCTVQHEPSGQMTMGHPAELGVFHIPYIKLARPKGASFSGHGYNRGWWKHRWDKYLSFKYK